MRMILALAILTLVPRSEVRAQIASTVPSGVAAFQRTRQDSVPSADAYIDTWLRSGFTAPTLRLGDPVLLGFSAAPRGSHWKTGFIIGTVVGATAAIIYAGGHGNDRLTVREGVLSIGLGALLGGVPGALIGGLFPKD
jgi:hypothetical protein